MDFYSVLDTILDEVGFIRIALLLILVAAVYYTTFRRRIKSIIDPLAYILIFSAFTIILLIILNQLQVVSEEKLSFSILTLFVYYGTFLLASRARRRSMRTIATPHISSISLFILFSANCLLLGITYIFFGIPLFLEARLSLWTGGGGFGVIGRLTSGLEFVSLMMGMLAIKRQQSRRWGIALISQFTVAAILSGSKGSLLNLAWAWYLTEVYMTGTWRVRLGLSLRTLPVLLTLLMAPLLTIVLQNDGAGIVGASKLYLTRIAAEGDGYVYFFGSNLIDSISHMDYLAIIRPVLTGLRLAPVETAINPGFEVMREVFGIDDPNAGPNSRLPIYILYFYGYAGLILVPLLGFMLGRSRVSLMKASGKSAYRYAILATIYWTFTKFEVDPQIAVGNMFNLALAAPVIWIAYRLGRPRKRASPGKPPLIASGGQPSFGSSLTVGTL